MTANIFALLESTRFLPLWTSESAEDAGVVGDALEATGSPIVEVALRTPAAMDALEGLAARPGIVVGAGTVVRPQQIDEAADRGAGFVVSPGFSEELVVHAGKRGLAVLPGVSTPSDVLRAVAAGVDRVKLFPAALLGGVPWISALAAPFPGVRFMPSGGVTAANAPEYLAHVAVFAVSGSWMLDAGAIAARRLDVLTAALETMGKV